MSKLSFLPVFLPDSGNIKFFPKLMTHAARNCRHLLRQDQVGTALSAAMRFHSQICKLEESHGGSVLEKKGLNMKRLVVIAAVFLMIGSQRTLAADEGATLFKSKCAGCHGASGEGKTAIKAPALRGTSLEASQIVEHITKGESTSKPPHNKGISGLSENQAKAIADYVKTLR